MDIKQIIGQLIDIRCNSEEMAQGEDKQQPEETVWDLDLKAIDAAIPLLEKQISKKVESKTEDIDNQYGKCPRCGNHVDDENDRNYCQECGQRLDWSEEIKNENNKN
jgi:hypothetical protein